MTKDKFWEVINNARAIAPALEGEPLRESLYKQLLKLSPDELVGFDCAWQEYRRIANSPQLIAAACIINGGTSDDRFDYFKNWLILQGQYAFRQALKNPDTLAALRIPFDDTEWEDCGYLTSLAFVGRALPTYFAQEGIAKELRRKYPALLQAPGALDAEIMRVLLYPNREQEQAFDRYLLGLEVQHYIDISGLDSYDKFYLEHISCRWEWDYLRESIREETPQPRQGKLIFNDLQRIQDIKSMQNEASNAVHTEILQISKQLHNLTRIHAQGYIEETVYQERRIRIEQQLAEKKKCLTCQKQNETAEKALYQTKQIDRYMQSHTALTEFDEEAMRTIVKKIVVSNEAFVFELPNGLHLKEKR